MKFSSKKETFLQIWNKKNTGVKSWWSLSYLFCLPIFSCPTQVPRLRSAFGNTSLGKKKKIKSNILYGQICIQYFHLLYLPQHQTQLKKIKTHRTKKYKIQVAAFEIYNYTRVTKCYGVLFTCLHYFDAKTIRRIKKMFFVLNKW